MPRNNPATINAYLGANWTWRGAWQPEDEAYVVRIAELPDYVVAGATASEAWNDAGDALRSLVDAYLTRGIPIPVPPPATMITVWREPAWAPRFNAVAVAA